MKVKPLDCRLIKKALKAGIGEPDPVPGWRCSGYRNSETGLALKKCRRCRAFAGYKNKQMTELIERYNRKKD